jgi:hypothetical protein
MVKSNVAIHPALFQICGIKQNTRPDQIRECHNISMFLTEDFQSQSLDEKSCPYHIGD